MALTPSQVKARALAAFRDDVVQGVPASGDNPPSKAEIRRALSDAVDYTAQVEGTAINGIRGYPTAADLPTLTSSETGTLAKIAGDETVRRWTGSTWVLFDDPVLAAADRAEAAADAVALVEGAVLGLNPTLSPVRATGVSAPATGAAFAPGVGFQPIYWGFGIVTPRPLQPAALRVQLKDLSVAVTGFDLKVYSRAKATADAEVTLTSPGDLPGDVLVFDEAYTPADVALGPLVSTGTECVFDLSAMAAMTPDKAYLVVITVSMSGGQAVFTVATRPGTTLPEYRRGYYSQTLGSAQAVSSTFDLAWSLDEQVQVSRDARTPERETVSATTRPSLVGSSTPILIPGLRIDRPSGALIIAEQDVNIPATTPVSVSETITPASGAETLLQYRFLRGTITVTRTSDSTVLTEGSDYRLDRERGALTLVTGVEVTVAYTGHPSRYDLLSVDPVTGVLTNTQGTPRKREAEEYAATLPGLSAPLAPVAAPAGNIPLFSVLRGPSRVELIPVHEYRAGFPVGREAQTLDWLEHCRRCLPKLLKRLTLSQAVKIVGYGDSITAQGYRLSAQNTTPNGIGRDLIGYLEAYETDTRALIPTYDTGDGAGSVHIREGWNWHLKAALEARYGSTITYENWGISGTDSSGTSFVDGGDTYYNGRHPTRLGPASNAGGHLLVLAFGMNEIDLTAQTYENLTTIIEAFKVGGAEVIVLPMVQENGVWGSRSQLVWRMKHDEIVRAAIDTNSAYVSTWALFGEGNEGATGLSRLSHSAASYRNHPGRRELRAVGDAMARIFA